MIVNTAINNQLKTNKQIKNSRTKHFIDSQLTKIQIGSNNITNNKKQ